MGTGTFCPMHGDQVRGWRAAQDVPVPISRGQGRSLPFPKFQPYGRAWFMGAQEHAFAEDRYDTMIYRRCGRWGLKLPAISLGAWETFGGYRDEAVARECLFRAFDLGITHFDLANNYGTPPGNAEIVVGRALKEMP